MTENNKNKDEESNIFEEDRYKHYVEEENISPEKSRKMAKADELQERERLRFIEIEKREAERRALQSAIWERSESTYKREPDDILESNEEELEDIEDESKIYPKKERKEKTIDEAADNIFGGIKFGTSKVLKTLKNESKESSPERHSRKYEESREQPFKNLGKNSMGAKKYEHAPLEPDFFGSSERFNIGTNNPFKQIERIHTRKPPETKVPYSGGKTPSTKIPFSGNRPPSTSFPMVRGKASSTRYKQSAKPSTYVPKIKGRPPSTRTKKAYPSTKIPKGSKKSPVSQDRPLPVKVNIKKQGNVLDELGLRGFW